MKSKISALMDGELHDFELSEPLRALHEDPEALDAWRRYHLIGDALRDTCVLSEGFSARFETRLAAEPAVLAPAALARRAGHRQRWVALSAVAGVAGVALVGWMAFAPVPGSGPEIAQLEQPRTRLPELAQVRVPAAPAENAVVPLPSETNDYLLAHQNFSPRSTLQGVAPYVRTVSETTPSR